MSQHRAVLAPGGHTPTTRPEPGPIAVLPEPEERFVRAIEEAGGTVAPLSDETRGLVWLSYSRAQEAADVLERHPGIGWVQLPWAGVDAFADVLAPFAQKDLPVFTSAKGAYAQPVAEHALTLTLALLRKLHVRARAKRWADEAPKAGTSLYGLNVVVIGAGGIAIELLRLLQPFDTRVTIVRRSADPVEGAERTVTSDRLAEVLPDADVVVVAAALTQGTSKLLGEREFSLMKPTAVLVNIARGGLVDTDALVAALEAGELADAALDVTDPEPLPEGHALWGSPRALITPHAADTEEMVAPLLAERIKANTAAFVGDGEFVGVVNPAEGY
ncbi:NAD(P)-dependent oxidoreductase [Herbiconiux sp. SYSU D00978]|uniref:NAD(P)-dependent oxidoreductase n=1 Tax=Herbiconiux sp. SYSU D00978 TaxID=2812562 RepID=UPI001A97CF15|nr:NAD(P)-dependent oxidoreductase [Herbiconiux sp. SYSU D00978]